MPDDPKATSEPTTPSSGADSEGWLDEAPGGDALFSDLFPSDEDFPGAAEVAAQAEPTAEPQTPAEPAPAPDAPFLKGKYSTYDTPEAAALGTDQKDEIIERYRQEGISRDGIDPLTRKPVPQEPASYLDNGKQYFQDLRTAVEKNDEAAYMQAQSKLIDDHLDQRFAPVRPILERAARSQALESAGSDVQDIQKFLDSPAYNSVMEANPTLKNAIAISEGDFQFQSELPGLYKLAHLASQGMRLPELLKNQAETKTAASPQAAPQARATQTSSSMPAPTSTRAVEPDWSTSEGRQEIIRRSEALASQLKW